MSEIQAPKAKWYVEIQERFSMMTERLALPEDVASELKVFLFEIARQQYKSGNNSGIRWARQQALKGQL